MHILRWNPTANCGRVPTSIHAIGDQGIAIHDFAQVIGTQLGVPVKSITPDQAKEHFGWMAPFIQFDCPAASDNTRRRFDWTPTQPGLMTELDSAVYFPC